MRVSVAAFVLAAAAPAVLTASDEAWRPDLRFSIEGGSLIETLTFISGMSYALTETHAELKRLGQRNFFCFSGTVIGSKLLVEILNERHAGSISSEEAVSSVVVGLKERYPCG